MSGRGAGQESVGGAASGPALRPLTRARSATPQPANFAITIPTVRLRFFTIPVFDSDTAQAELDHFLTTHRMLAVDRELIADGMRSAWAVCVR